MSDLFINEKHFQTCLAAYLRRQGWNVRTEVHVRHKEYTQCLFGRIDILARRGRSLRIIELKNNRTVMTAYGGARRVIEQLNKYAVDYPRASLWFAMPTTPTQRSEKKMLAAGIKIFVLDESFWQYARRAAPRFICKSGPKPKPAKKGKGRK
jgi:Holliday junction resolvase-like predicted endonuclease